MPFTFSHPSIVIPLHQLKPKWFSLTGLIIGSMSPDFEYFLRMKIQSEYSHTILGLFTFCLPVSLLSAFIFHYIIRDSLIENTPKFLQKRLLQFHQFNWYQYFKKNWFIVVYSILIGAFSHTFWDSFTHYTGYFVEHIHLLQESTILPHYKILQHGSTLVGGLYLLFYVYQQPIQKKKFKVNILYWVSFIITIIVVMSLKIMQGLSIYSYRNVIVSLISSGALGFIISPFILKKITKKKTSA
ncbi:MAG: DUF4184 family protein [Cytophagales bacterium]|nr:DUF4184 family protein [Cytophagales bacterium]